MYIFTSEEMRELLVDKIFKFTLSAFRCSFVVRCTGTNASEENISSATNFRSKDFTSEDIGSRFLRNVNVERGIKGINEGREKAAISLPLCTSMAPPPFLRGKKGKNNFLMLISNITLGIHSACIQIFLYRI
jgi:hypothetical protein